MLRLGSQGMLLSHGETMNRGFLGWCGGGAGCGLCFERESFFGIRRSGARIAIRVGIGFAWFANESGTKSCVVLYGQF